MRVLYIHQYFATLDGATGTRSYEFARRLVRRGHEVIVLTGPTHLGATVPREAGWVFRTECEGISLVVANVRYHQTMSYLRRTLSFALFAVLTSWLALRLPRPDVTYATSTPLTVFLPALAGRWWRRVPYVFEVRDVWPAVPVGIGLIRKPWIVALSKWLERRAYLGARHIVPLSAGMDALVREAVGDRRPRTVIPNCCDLELFGRGDRTGFRSRQGWLDRCVLVHTGALGRINGLEAVICAADALHDEGRPLFVLVGEGRERSALQGEAERRGVRNVVFMGPMPKAQMPDLLAAADVCLVTVAPFAVLEHNCANKFFDALAAGKPVVLNYSGWQREVLESAGAGFGCPQGDEREFVTRLRELIRSPGLREEMGRNARRLAESRFSRQDAFQRFENVLRSVAGGDRAEESARWA